MNSVKTDLMSDSNVADIFTTASWPPANRFMDLLEIAFEALHLYPGDPRYRRDQDPFPCVGEHLQKSRLYGYSHGKNAP